jgi:hypothetical protein
MTNITRYVPGPAVVGSPPTAGPMATIELDNRNGFPGPNAPEPLFVEPNYDV